MNPPPQERGAALLTVLMLVAVIATLSAASLDRLTVSARLAGNAAIAAQGRHWLGFAEQLAAARLEDLAAADATRTLTGPWLGTVRQVRLPDGGLIEAEVSDGGNCFNLNSLVQRDGETLLVVNPRTVQQFSALLQILGVDTGRANGIAEAAADWIDSDDLPLGEGAEAGSYGGAAWQPSNSMMASASELGAVRGVTPDLLSVAGPFLCALPEASPSALNPNTMAPEQAVLLAMLAPGQLSLAQVRGAIAGRPAGGYESSVAFWQSPALAGAEVPSESAQQIRLKSRWFSLRATLRNDGQSLSSRTLIDLTTPRARIVTRRYGEGA
jgi:general secretion pathway protein K